MAKRWTKQQEIYFRKELHNLYIVQNLSLSQVAEMLSITEAAVFVRLKRLGIKTIPEKKSLYLNKIKDVVFPDTRSVAFAEFLGIMFGDGHVSHSQVLVTLGNKEIVYVQYVKHLLENLFSLKARISIRNGFKQDKKYRNVYISSVVLSKWLKTEGLVSNKVISQVDVAPWIFTKKEFMEHFLRGFFDTDGSVYKLTYGVQISFSNRSVPLLKSLQVMLSTLGYSPSILSVHKVYLTRKKDVIRFFSEIKPSNIKHKERFEKIVYASIG